MWAAALLFCLSRGPLAQPGPDTGDADQSLEELRSWSDLADDYLQAIEAEESRNGPYSEDLVDPLLSLGLGHQEHGQHDLAIDAFERALQVRRVNEGLRNLDHLPLLESMAESYSARGDVVGVTDVEGRMLELGMMNPSDPRSVDVLRTAADRELAQYEWYRENGFPPQVTISSNRNGGPPQFGSGGYRASFGLRQARRNYMVAIQNILRRGAYDHEDLVELEQELTRTYYLELTGGSSLSPNRSALLYSLGRNSYRRRVVYAAARSNSPTEFAKALVELADWDLLFSRNGQALGRYQEAYEMLVRWDAPEEEIKEIFDPETPVTLPTFVPNPLEADEPNRQAEHIDVAFKLGRFGTSRRIDFVDVSDDISRKERRRLLRVIAGNRYRPRLIDGEPDSTTPVSLRYFVDD
jgi:tetratricopeptide (TPR) repeat protein